jgi:hypothetical protein
MILGISSVQSGSFIYTTYVKWLFLGQNLANFWLEKYDWTYTKDFPWKKMAQIHQISNFFFPRSPDYYDKFLPALSSASRGPLFQ